MCRLPADAAAPPVPAAAGLYCVMRTARELSVVCDERLVPSDAVCERGWNAMALEGPIPFETTGVLASLAAALAGAGVPVFAISTYDTDVLLVKSADASRATTALGEGGFEFSD